MTALQWIVKEAKSLKKSYPKRFTKWTDYVKQASAIYASKHKGKSPVGKKKIVKKVAVKKAAPKKVYGTKKLKPISEQTILNKIHKVKDQVNKLDEAQHKHMILAGVNNQNVLKDIEKTKSIIKEQSELLLRLQDAYKKSKSKINKELLMLDIKTLKFNFLPHNKKYLKSLQILLKKSI